ncbi:response regulator transcription factor [Chloroflexota bacterium]
MLKSLVITPEDKTPTELCENLERSGLTCSVTSYNNGVSEALSNQQPDILFIQLDTKGLSSEIWALIRRLKKERTLLVIALIPEEMLPDVDIHLEFDDFIILPYHSSELSLRINRLLHRTRNMENSELIKCDGLMIDLARCEVSIEGIPVELTFKEYELLKLLASNKGRVYTREALLDKIWGYDYYGGDRTVDVHVRRLRSKIENAKHKYIDTVRNIGYRFIKNTG